MSKKVVKTQEIDYSDKKIDLLKLKKCDLKKISKYHRLHVSGSKPILINRIQEFLNTDRKVILMQKILRGYFVKKSFQLRGSAFKNRSICTNETDFYTLEPLSEIPFETFFSYTDEKNFTYGFDIISLVSLYFKMGKLNNPYNRNKFPLSTVLDIFSLYGKIKILFKEYVPDNSYIRIPCSHQYTSQNVPQNPMIEIHDIVVVTRRPREVRIYNMNRNILFLIPDDQQTEPNIAFMSQNLLRIEQLLINKRTQPINTRIQELFMEIDQLENITNSNWFTNLDTRELYRFYVNLQDLWNYRARIIPIEKEKIYPFGDPFLIANEMLSRIDIEIDISLRRDIFLNMCTTVMENLVFSAPDIENRKIGTMHVLRALTSVSYEARIDYNYLYESISW